MFFHVPKEEREELKMMLDRMISEGKLIITNDGRYSKPEPSELVGTFSGTARGFGFVVVEGRKDDIFISGDYTLGALHGDTVAVKITKQPTGDRRCEGQIVRIVSRANETIIGTFDKSKKYGFVIPDNVKFSQDIFVRNENSMGAVGGHKVLVKITDYGSKNRNPEGVITEIIGHIDDPQTDHILTGILKHVDIKHQIGISRLNIQIQGLHVFLYFRMFLLRNIADDLQFPVRVTRHDTGTDGCRHTVESAGVGNHYAFDVLDDIAADEQADLIGSSAQNLPCPCTGICHGNRLCTSHGRTEFFHQNIDVLLIEKIAFFHGGSPFCKFSVIISAFFIKINRTAAEPVLWDLHGGYAGHSSPIP